MKNYLIIIKLPILLLCFIQLAYGADIIINQSDGTVDNIKALGELLETKYKIEKEKKEIEKAEKIADSKSAVEVGDAYLQQGDAVKASHYYHLALKINEFNTDAHQKLSRISSQRDAIEKKIGKHYHLAMKYLRMGNKKKAVDELIIEIKANPENEEARIKLNEIEMAP